MNKKTIYTILTLCLILILVVGAFGAFALVVFYRSVISSPSQNQNQNQNPIQNQRPNTVTTGDFVQFQSDEEFQTFIAAHQETYQSRYSSGMGMMDEMMLKTETAESLPTNAPVSDVAPQRYSDTNVQVKGIDEADIVKTNGQEIFISPEYLYYDYLMPSEKITDDYTTESIAEYTAKTNVISALPPESISKLSDIDKNGQLLLIGDNLVIFSYDTIYTYDVSDPKNPIEKWNYSLSDYNTSFYQYRSFNDKLYVITQTSLYGSLVCPMPLMKGKVDFSVTCSDIFHPTSEITSNVNYTVMQIDPSTGNIEKNISMVGSYDSSVLYMSPENIFIAYRINGDMVQFFHDFLIENNELFSSNLISKITKLNSYEISDAAKMLEMETILNEYYSGLNQDDRLKLENDLQNSVNEYLSSHKRELESTMINRINIQNFSVEASGTVPGTLLNSFSMDEYNKFLRIATTTANNIWGLPISIPNTESINDVYVLDSKLQTIGSVLDMGAGERIYSVRFNGNQGYVVTFKETDPFYVLDLTSPSSPQKVGELKIPGYSSYLHPISDSLVLGIGKEDQNVKISLFDVSNPSKPTEIDKYSLSEYWSDILSTHHAFLLDSKHQVFFIPGSSGGYIFSYQDNKITLQKAVESINAQRAIYINDYMYIIGQEKIIVLDEKTWERINEFSIR